MNYSYMLCQIHLTLNRLEREFNSTPRVFYAPAWTALITEARELGAQATADHIQGKLDRFEGIERRQARHVHTPEPRPDIDEDYLYWQTRKDLE